MNIVASIQTLEKRLPHELPAVAIVYQGGESYRSPSSSLDALQHYIGDSALVPGSNSDVPFSSAEDAALIAAMMMGATLAVPVHHSIHRT